jgi:hypothetical protein
VFYRRRSDGGIETDWEELPWPLGVSTDVVEVLHKVGGRGSRSRISSSSVSPSSTLTFIVKGPSEQERPSGGKCRAGCVRGAGRAMFGGTEDG